jgi:hypothetical protein
MSSLFMRLFFGLFVILVTAGIVRAQDGVPHYCQTDAGVLGRYPNDGSVKVGDPCYGTKGGQGRASSRQRKAT